MTRAWIDALLRDLGYDVCQGDYDEAIVWLIAEVHLRRAEVEDREVRLGRCNFCHLLTARRLAMQGGGKVVLTSSPRPDFARGVDVSIDYGGHIGLAWVSWFPVEPKECACENLKLSEE